MTYQDIPTDFKLSSYQFPLPEDRIAQYPLENRSDSRLLIFKRHDPNNHPQCIHSHFKELINFLPKNALLVANNSKVLPARILGTRSTGGKFEFLLLTPLPILETQEKEVSGFKEVICEGLLRMGGKVKVGLTLNLGEDFELTVLEIKDFGRIKVRLKYCHDLKSLFHSLGQMPLPPYIKRPLEKSDQERYQTIYAKKEGSVAAPTAGLHFTPSLKKSLLEQGIEWAEVTLYVGYGTFSPIRCQDIREHVMHSEYVEISQETATAINQARASQRPIIAIGTTSLRALEGVYQIKGQIASFSGWTNIFIYPGKPFRVCDGLLTNFHLPESSLIMLVSAFVSRKQILEVYKEALDHGYRFFSYGDAMLILP